MQFFNRFLFIAISFISLPKKIRNRNNRVLIRKSNTTFSVDYGRKQFFNKRKR